MHMLAQEGCLGPARCYYSGTMRQQVLLCSTIWCMPLCHPSNRARARAGLVLCCRGAQTSVAVVNAAPYPPTALPAGQGGFDTRSCQDVGSQQLESAANEALNQCYQRSLPVRLFISVLGSNGDLKKDEVIVYAGQYKVGGPEWRVDAWVDVSVARVTSRMLAYNVSPQCSLAAATCHVCSALHANTLLPPAVDAVCPHALAFMRHTVHVLLMPSCRW